MRRHIAGIRQKAFVFPKKKTCAINRYADLKCEVFTRNRDCHMHATIFSATTIGIDAHKVAVEVDVSLGLVQFYIVGLPDTAIKESSKRIRTALQNSGIRLPAKRITVNLAPADLKKEGTLLTFLLRWEFLRKQISYYRKAVFTGNTFFRRIVIGWWSVFY